MTSLQHGFRSNIEIYLLWMWTLVSLLIFTAIVLPYILMNYDEPLTDNQYKVLEHMLTLAFWKGVLVFVVSVVT